VDAIEPTDQLERLEVHKKVDLAYVEVGLPSAGQWEATTFLSKEPGRRRG